MAAPVVRRAFAARLLQIRTSNSSHKFVTNSVRCLWRCQCTQQVPLVSIALQSNTNERSRRFEYRNLLWAGMFSFFGLGEEKKEDELINTIKLAVFNMQQGKLDKAERILHLALKIAQERMEHQGITYVYDMLANVAFQKGEYKKAEKLFIETMKRLLSTGTTKTSNAMVDISLKLAVIYSSRGDNNKAEEGFLFCINTQQAKLDDQPADLLDDDTQLLWAMSVDYYARHLMKNSRLTKAKYYFEQALNMSTRINGEKHPQTVVLLNDLGSVCSLLHEYHSAVEFLSRAIEIGVELGSQDLPAFYCNLGAVYINLNKFEEAKMMCENALRVATKIGNKEAENEARDCLKEIKNAEKVITFAANV